MNRTFTGFIFDSIKIVAFTLVFAVLLFAFVFKIILVDGGSMYDTLCDKDCVLVTDYNPDIYSPSRGDIVAIAAYNSSSDFADIDDTDISGHHEKSIIKRIIAVAGDTIGFDADKGDVYVNGKIIDEPYVYSPTYRGVQWDIPDVIPEGYVFVMGDNRVVSKDSRSSDIKLVRTQYIIGKAQFVLYPFYNFGYLY